MSNSNLVIGRATAINHIDRRLATTTDPRTRENLLAMRFKLNAQNQAALAPPARSGVVTGFRPDVQVVRPTAVRRPPPRRGSVGSRYFLGSVQRDDGAPTLFSVSPGSAAPAIFSPDGGFEVVGLDFDYIDHAAGFISTANYVATRGHYDIRNPVLTQSSNVWSVTVPSSGSSGLVSWTTNPFCGMSVVIGAPEFYFSPRRPTIITASSLFTEDDGQGSGAAETGGLAIGLSYTVSPHLNGQMFHIPFWSKASGQTAPVARAVVAGTPSSGSPTTLTFTLPNSNYDAPVVYLWTSRAKQLSNAASLIRYGTPVAA